MDGLNSLFRVDMTSKYWGLNLHSGRPALELLNANAQAPDIVAFGANYPSPFQDSLCLLHSKYHKNACKNIDPSPEELTICSIDNHIKDTIMESHDRYV